MTLQSNSITTQELTHGWDEGLHFNLKTVFAGIGGMFLRHRQGLHLAKIASFYPQYAKKNPIFQKLLCP